MDERRKKCGWGFRIAMCVSVIVLYLTSFGALVWSNRLDWRKKAPAWVNERLLILYRPISRLAMYGPEPIREPLRKYVRLCDPRIVYPEIPQGPRPADQNAEAGQKHTD